MSLNILTIVLEWDNEKQRYVRKSKIINPNLAEDIKKLKKEIVKE